MYLVRYLKLFSFPLLEMEAKGKITGEILRDNKFDESGKQLRKIERERERERERDRERERNFLVSKLSASSSQSHAVG